MGDESATGTLREIKRLLDEHVAFDGAEDLTIVERVRDVINAMDSWTALAIARLHRIHRLSGNDCDYCPKYLDGVAM